MELKNWMEQPKFVSGRTGRLAWASLVLVSAVLVSCAGDVQEDRQFGLDATVSCPDGYVGWKFPTTVTNPNTSLYQSGVGGTDVRLLPAVGIEVASATCGTNVSTEEDAIRGTCSGSPDCKYATRCLQALTVTYTCGVGDTDPKTELPRVYTAKSAAGSAGRDLSIVCAPPAPAAEPLPAKTACVPKYCHGKTRRDALMACVPDETMQVVTPNIISTTLRPVYDPGREDCADWNQTTDFCIDKDGGKPGKYPLFKNTYYEIRMWVDFGAAKIPEDAKFTVWMAQQYGPTASAAALLKKSYLSPTDPETKLLFNCVATTLSTTDALTKAQDTASGYIDPDGAEGTILSGSIGKSAGLRLIRKRIEISPECQSDQRNSQVASQLAALGTPMTDLGAKLMISYDMEGKTLFIDRSAPVEPEAACAPNPPDFYWRSTYGDHDMVEYLKQRYVSYLGPWSSKRFHWVEPTRYQIGADSIQLGAAEVEVNKYPGSNVPLPVDITWHAANATMRNAFSPRRTPAGYGTSNLQANVYIWPADRRNEKGRYPLIGAIPLSAGYTLPFSPDGVTATKDLSMGYAVRSKFFDKNSPLYIPDTMKSRMYEVFYCIGSGSQNQPFNGTNDPRSFFLQDAKGSGAPYIVDSTYFKYVVGNPKSKVVLGALPVGTYKYPANPLGFDQNFGGCALSPVPLVVKPDRLVRSVPPVASTSLNDLPSNTESGSSAMSGSTDNDLAVVCRAGNTDETNCTDTNNNGLGGNGDLGMSYFDMNMGSDRDKGKTASADVISEVLGFQISDSFADEDAEVTWPSKATPVEIVLAPNWGAIVMALNAGAPKKGVLEFEWETGKFAGMVGLGLGVGIKIPFQAGPIPGMLIITATVGLSIEFKAAFQGAPEEGDEYPCIGSTDCVVVADEEATFEDAHSDCVSTGGRLAEPKTLVEYNLLKAALADEDAADSFWVGGQSAYEHVSTECGETFNKSYCLEGSNTSYRWISNDDQFALGSDGRTAEFINNKYFGPNGSTLTTQIPTAAALVFNKGTQRLSTAVGTEEHPYACFYERASGTFFFGWGLGAEIGAAAGLGLALCVPTDDPGVCIEGSLNIIALKLEFEYQNTYTWLLRGTSVYGRRGTTEMSIPWSLSLFEGDIAAAINFSIGFLAVKIKWTIVEFGGFKLAEGSLFDFEASSSVNY